MNAPQPTPIAKEYSPESRQKRITTILQHPLAVQLNATDRRVLKKVASYERRFNGCRLSQTKIGKQVGLSSRKQVNRVLGKLESLGFILRGQERRPNGSLSTCKITLNDALIRQVLGLEPVTGMSHGEASECTELVVSVGKECPSVMSHGVSHGMSHGMSHLEEAIASVRNTPAGSVLGSKSLQAVTSSPEGETLLELDHVATDDSVAIKSFTLAPSVAREDSAYDPLGFLTASWKAEVDPIGQNEESATAALDAVALVEGSPLPWVSSGDDEPSGEPPNLRWLQHVVSSYRVQGFRELMAEWDEADRQEDPGPSYPSAA